MSPYSLQTAKRELSAIMCLILQSHFGCQTLKTTHLNVDSHSRASYRSQVSWSICTPPLLHFPGGKAVLPPTIKTEGKPTSNSESLAHSKSYVMQQKQRMVPVQERGLGGCPARLPGPLLPLASPLAQENLQERAGAPPAAQPCSRIPARSLQTETAPSPPQPCPRRSGPAQGQARPGRDHGERRRPGEI